MKRLILIFPIVVLLCTSAKAGENAPAEAGHLIRDLPTRDQLIADVALLRTDSQPNEKRHGVVEGLKKAQDGFMRLKELLHPGASVFDYPGLFALSRPVYTDFADRYSMVLGIPPGWNWDDPQGVNPNEFRISFDGRGIIIAIDAVLYRH